MAPLNDWARLWRAFLILFSFLLILLSTNLSGQEWQQEYDFGTGLYVEQLDNDNFQVLGEAFGNQLAIETDSLGNSLNMQNFGPGNLRAIANKEYILWKEVFNNASDPLVARLDPSGNTIWEQEFGNPAFNEQINDMIQTNDQHLLFFGVGDTIIGTSKSYLFAQKVDLNGNTLWRSVFSVDDLNTQIPERIIECTNGDILCGFSYLPDLSIKFIRLNAGGAIVNDTITYFNQGFRTTIGDVVPASDGGYFLALNLTTNPVNPNLGDEIYLLKEGGNEQWSQQWIGSQFDILELLALTPTSDQGVIVTSNNFGLFVDDQAVSRFDAQGNLLWSRIVPTMGMDIIEKDIDQFVITGIAPSGRIYLYNLIDTIGSNLTGPDLELFFTVVDPSLEIYTFRTIQLTTVNTGDTTMSDIEIEFGLPPFTAYVNHQTSKGNYNLFFETWTISALAPGENATLDLEVFLLEDDFPITTYAEVSEAVPFYDIDSSPANGICCGQVEDDEASFVLGGIPIESDDLDLEIKLMVDDAELATLDPRLLTLEVINKGSVTGEGVQVEFPVPEHTAYLDHEVSQGDFDVLAGLWTINNIPPGGMAVLQYKIEPLSNQFPIEVFTQILSAAPNDIDSEPGNADCCEPTEDDEALVTISNPTLGGDGTDLEITLSIDDPSLAIYQLRTATLEVFNNSDQEATNIIIDFSLPSGTAYTSHMTSQGTYLLFFGQWNVGTLPPGETAIFELTFFTLTENGPIDVFAQVLQAQPFDIDSSPGNAVCCTPAEDDEAYTALDNSQFQYNDNQPLVIGKPRDKIDIPTISLYPNPAIDQLQLSLSNLSDEYPLSIRIIDSKGGIHWVKKYPPGIFENIHSIDISELPNGWFVCFIEQGGTNQQVPFLKVSE